MWTALAVAVAVGVRVLVVCVVQRAHSEQERGPARLVQQGASVRHGLDQQPIMIYEADPPTTRARHERAIRCMGSVR